MPLMAGASCELLGYGLLAIIIIQSDRVVAAGITATAPPTIRRTYIVPGEWFPLPGLDIEVQMTTYSANYAACQNTCKLILPSTQLANISLAKTLETYVKASASNRYYWMDSYHVTNNGKCTLAVIKPGSTSINVYVGFKCSTDAPCVCQQNNWIGDGFSLFCITNATSEYRSANTVCGKVNATMALGDGGLLLRATLLADQLTGSTWINQTDSTSLINNKRTAIMFNVSIHNISRLQVNKDEKLPVLCERVISTNQVTASTVETSTLQPSAISQPTGSTNIIFSSSTAISIPITASPSGNVAATNAVAPAGNVVMLTTAPPSGNMTTPTTVPSAGSVGKTSTRQFRATTNATDITVSANNATQATSSSKQPPNPHSPEVNWTMFGNREFYVNYNRSTYTEASEFCRTTLNSTLAAFCDIMKYFEIISQLSLKPDNFWVDDPIFPADKDCLSLHAGLNSLSTTECHHRFYSVCNRFVSANNDQQVLEKSDFTQMIKAMTVEKNTTHKAQREKSCAEDERAISRTSGAVAISLIVAVGSLFILMDFAKCVHFMHNTYTTWTRNTIGNGV